MSFKQNLVNKKSLKEFVSRLDTIMEKLSGLNDNTIQIIQIGALKGMKMKKEKKEGAQSFQRYSNGVKCSSIYEIGIARVEYKKGRKNK